jgi:type VI protein secretion system component Hcp
MKKITLLFSFLLCCTLAFSQSMFLDAGPQVPADEPQGQPVLSYSFGASNDMTVTLVTGAMSPELFLAVATGTPFSKMEIKVYDGQNKVEQKITLHNVFVTSFQTGLGSTETVTLSFDKIKTKDFGHEL